MDKKVVENKLTRAYQRLVRDDIYLFTADVNERSITHKLAEYLQVEFFEYHVDCEYNRDGIDPKKLDFSVSTTQSDDTEASTVYPDIIVHHRGTSNNIVVIEAKKLNINLDLDRNKLRLYKDRLGYQYAYAVVFPIGKASEEFHENLVDQMIKEIDEDL